MLGGTQKQRGHILTGVQIGKMVGTENLGGDEPEWSSPNMLGPKPVMWRGNIQGVRNWGQGLLQKHFCSGQIKFLCLLNYRLKKWSFVFTSSVSQTTENTCMTITRRKKKRDWLLAFKNTCPSLSLCLWQLRGCRKNNAVMGSRG